LSRILENTSATPPSGDIATKTSALKLRKSSGNRGLAYHVLLYVEDNEWQIEQKRNPVSVDKEEECKDAVDEGFRNDVGVETVAEIDRVDIITVDTTY